MKTERNMREERIYLFGMGCYLGISMLMNTMFYTLWNERLIYWGLHLGIFALFLLRVFWFRSYSGKETAFILAGLALTGLLFWKSGQGVLFDLYLLVVLGKGMPGYAVMKLYLVIKGSVLAAAFVASRLGIIPDLVYEAYRWGRNAYALGYPYYADLSANLLYFMFVFIAYREERLKPADGILALCLAGAAFLLCTTRTDSILLAVCGLAVLWHVFYGKKRVKWGEFWKRASLLGILFAAFGSLGATIWYRSLENVLAPVNRLLSSRLERGREVLDQYSISLWGQEIPFQGYGGLTYEETLALWEDQNTSYLFADNSYLRIALEYGLLVLLAVLSVMLLFYVRNWNAGRMMLCVMVFLTMLDGVIVHHLTEPQYNLFLILLWTEPFAGEGVLGIPGGKRRMRKRGGEER